MQIWDVTAGGNWSCGCGAAVRALIASSKDLLGFFRLGDEVFVEFFQLGRTFFPRKTSSALWTPPSSKVGAPWVAFNLVLNIGNFLGNVLLHF